MSNALQIPDPEGVSIDLPGVRPDLPKTDLERVYGHRFDEVEAARKERAWKEIVRYLQRYVPKQGRVLDLGCDRGYFIRNIEGGEKWAADIRDVREHLGPDIEFRQAPGLEVDNFAPNNYFDLIFMSNYLEHLPTGMDVVKQLTVASRLLRREGRVLILQPNIRLLGADYWDFIDHHTALTEKSLNEAAELAGLEKETSIMRFLPYTTRSRFPMHPLLVRAYLRLRPAWWLLGKQTLFVARKR